MSEDHIVRHCAPTLAGIKTGSLFLCSYDCRNSLFDAVRQLNRRLCPKGLRMLPLRLSQGRALIYLYRPSQLSADLADAAAADLLTRHGYSTDSSDRCVVQLVRRLREQEEFPHEIGLFLGYPPEDVCGFIENKAGRCKCVGCWKVYGDVNSARKKFAQYKKCTQLYCDRWSRGSSIEQLTVVG